MKTIMMSAIAISIGFAAGVQKVKEIAVPAVVKTAFAKAYPGTVAKWEKENNKFEVNFKKEGKEMSALY